MCEAIEAHLGGLVLEQGDGNVTKSGVEDYALGVAGVAASLGTTGRPGGRLRGGAGGGRALLVLAEH
jgi:hypothetical protein